MPAALVIDDNRQMAQGLCKMLAYLGLDATPVYGPRAGMIWLQSEVPDIVFLDISMPGVNGFEVLAYIKRSRDLAETPVIVVTSDDQQETARRAKAAGALQMLVKPVTLEKLESTLMLAHLL